MKKKILTAIAVFCAAQLAFAPIQIGFWVLVRVCIAAATVGGTGTIVYKCQAPWNIACDVSGDVPHWYITQANPATINKTGDKFWEGPFSKQEATDRTKNNNDNPGNPPWPQGPYGAAPKPVCVPTRFSLYTTPNGYDYACVASIDAADVDDGFMFAVLPPWGTNGMSAAELGMVRTAGCVVTNTIGKFPPVVVAEPILTEAASAPVEEQ
jgi:hypothetical protein